MNIALNDIREDITRSVKIALEEDIGSGDITAQLIPADKTDTARIITREDCVICGTAWVDETYKQLDDSVSIDWQVKDGDTAKAGTTLATLSGNSRALLTGERTALNFMQLLSGTATKAHQLKAELGESHIKLLDTRKTVPGLRTGQKYAVAIGGCNNHRIGLFDAFLIKENHISSCGSIKNAVSAAKQNQPDKIVEVEVENIDQLKQALTYGADIVMLDNFSRDMLSSLSNIDKGTVKYELSGNMSLRDIQKIKDYNIDYISFGTITKNVHAIDLSFRIL